MYRPERKMGQTIYTAYCYHTTLVCHMVGKTVVGADSVDYRLSLCTSLSSQSGDETTGENKGNRKTLHGTTQRGKDQFLYKYHSRVAHPYVPYHGSAGRNVGFDTPSPPGSVFVCTTYVPQCDQNQQTDQQNP